MRSLGDGPAHGETGESTQTMTSTWIHSGRFAATLALGVLWAAGWPTGLPALDGRQESPRGGFRSPTPADGRAGYALQRSDRAANPALKRQHQAAISTDTTALQRARELRTEGAHDAAARLIRRYLVDHPEQASVRWLLAETLYWAGEYRAARRELARALRTAPLPDGARELWRDLDRLWAPRVSVSGGLVDDNQPLDVGRGTVEADVPLGPRVRVLARGTPLRLDARETGSVGVFEGRLGLEADWPDVPVRTRLEGGAARWSERSGFVGLAAVEVGLPAGFELRSRARRWNYRHTATVLDTALFVETGGVRLARSDPTGWSGQVGGRVDRFPGDAGRDDNLVRHAWAWILAPLWSRGRNAIRVGYAFRYADADESTFATIPAGTPGSGGGGGGSGAGPGGGSPPGGGPTSGPVTGYDPYYTPEEVREHSALVALQAAPAAGVLLSLSGAAGLDAREEAPALAGTDGALEFGARDYTPWRAGGSVSVQPGAEWHLGAGVEYREDAFFEILELTVTVRHTFLSAPPAPGHRP